MSTDKARPAAERTPDKDEKARQMLLRLFDELSPHDQEILFTEVRAQFEEAQIQGKGGEL